MRRNVGILLSAAVSLLVFLAVVSQPASAQELPRDLRVMTWNVKTGFFNAEDWARVIGNQKPDVAGLQEICVREAEQLVKKLKDDYDLDYTLTAGSVRTGNYPGCDPYSDGMGNQPWPDVPVPGLPDIPGHDAPLGFGGAYGQVVLSQLPVRDAVNESLPDGGGIDEPRGYMAVTVDTPTGGPVRIFDTHITVGSSSGDDQAKLAARAQLQAQQVTALADDASAFAGRVLVMGDFNMWPEDPKLDVWDSVGFVEADRTRNSPTSENDFDDRGSDAWKKIDYIFTRGFETIGDPETYWVSCSDHRPLIANLRVA